MGKRPKYVFRQWMCKCCRRHEKLSAREVGVNASRKHNKKVIAELKKGQEEMIRSRLIDARDIFRDLGEREIPLGELLPHQNGLSHPDKMCYVANRKILNVPILVAKIGGLRFGPHRTEGVTRIMDKFIIIDGHTRAALKSGMTKDLTKETILARVLVFPTAVSFYESYLRLAKKYPTINAHLKSVMPGSKEFELLHRPILRSSKKVAKPCPAIAKATPKKKRGGKRKGKK